MNICCVLQYIIPYLCVAVVRSGIIFPMQELWVSIIHHVCNSHEWAGGKCLHQEMLVPSEGKQWLEPESEAVFVM